MPPTHLLVAAPAVRASRAPVERTDARAGGTRWIFVAAALVAVAAALGYLRTWPPLATVMSASMAPTINTGDVVVLKRLDAPATVGQVVMVRVPDDARARFGYPPVVIHRVVAISADGTVTTKGDAKKEIDPFTVPRTAITTRVLTHVPAAGQAFGFLSSTLGLLWLGGGAALFFGLPLVERYREGQRRLAEEREERELVIEDLRAQVEQLPVQVERAIANAVAAMEPLAARGATHPGAAAGLREGPDVAAAEPRRRDGAGADAPRRRDGAGPDAPRRRDVAGAAPGGLSARPLVVVAPPRLVSAGELAALALAGRAVAPAPPEPPVPAPRFVRAPEPPRTVLVAARVWSLRPAAGPGALCAVGGP